MNAGEMPASQGPLAPRPTGRSALGRLAIHGSSLLIAAAAFTAHEHFKLLGQSAPALASLIATAGFALVPVRALIGALFEIEGKALHLVHGVGGVAFVGLSLGGIISAAPVLRRAALAPFAIMGAAQALMHEDRPRDPRQAEAVRRFASSLPQVERFVASRDLNSPANAAPAVAVLGDLLSKGQALGETQWQADPGFQGVLERISARSGLSLGLDVADEAVDELADNPAAAGALPGLRARLAAARRTLAR